MVDIWDRGRAAQSLGSQPRALVIPLIYPVVRSFKDHPRALAAVAQWIEHWPANQRVTGSIQSGYMPGFWAGPPVGGEREANTH